MNVLLCNHATIHRPGRAKVRRTHVIKDLELMIDLIKVFLQVNVMVSKHNEVQ